MKNLIPDVPFGDEIFPQLLSDEALSSGLEFLENNRDADFALQI